MLAEILELLTKANDEWYVTYDEAKDMNRRADMIERDKGFAYVEEYKTRTLDLSGYVPAQRTSLTIYFCRFVNYPSEAVEREAVRALILREIVYPFVELYNTSGHFEPCDSWVLTDVTPSDARFDANETGIKLTFTAVERSLCTPPHFD